MKKSIGIAIAASAMIVSLNASQQKIDLSQGWNLVGTYVSQGDLSKNNDLSIIWKYAGGKWSAYSTESTIKAVLDKHKEIGQFNGKVSSGEGFWALAKNATSLSLDGTLTNSKLNISKGWNLLSLTSNKPLSVDYFKDVATIWKWDRANEKWQVYSPDSDLQSKIASKVADGTIETFNVIKPGEGFWVYGGSASEVDLTNPPSIGVAHELKSKLNAVPLTNAKVYASNGSQVGTTDNTGKLVGTTDNTGKFMIKGLSDGTTVTIKKDGYAVAYGVVKDGKVVILTQKDNNQKVAFNQGENFQKVAKIGITSQDGKVALIVNNMNLTKDVTVSVIPFMSPSAAPTLNNLTIGDKSIPVDQLALIGGAYINVEDTNGKLLDTNENIGTINFNLSQSTILGDLEDILNGGAESLKYQQFSANAFTQFDSMITNGMIEIVVAQFIGGKWVYKGEGKLASYNKKQKKPDITYTKYKLQTSASLDKLAPTAFLLKMNYLTGTTDVCSHEEGYKMFDGSIVNKNQSDQATFDWIGDPIPLVTVIGDDSVESGAGLTGDNGCIKVTYKVPFMKPTFNLALKKDGYYDTEVSCSVDSDGAKCSDADLYKIPDTASIEGHVTDKVTKDGIANALVTLENPEVLSADKVQSGDENGTAYVKVGYMPNVTYTWSAVKYDENNNSNKVVDSIVIKTGKGNASYAKLSEKEIYEKLVKPFDDGSNNFDAKYLTGNWELRVKAVHKYTNDANMTEEAIGKFDIDLLMKKLTGLMSSQLSESKVKAVVDENGNETTLPKSIKSASVYGGFSIGFLYEFGAQNDAFEWQTTLLGNIDGSDGKICNDYNATDVNTNNCSDDPIAEKVGINYLNIAKGDVLTYGKSLYPVGYNVKFMAKHFAELLNTDPACNGDSSCEGDPFIKSGFTVRTLFKGTISVPSTDENGNTTENNVTQYLGSYSQISGANSVSDVLDTTEISLVGSSATAYMRQVLTDSKNPGYYRINMIPPALNGGLEVFAKADGYKFNVNSDIKLVDDLEKGKVSTYDLELEPVDSNIIEKNTTTGEINVPPMPVSTNSFGDWNLTGCSVNSKSKWQVVTNPLSIDVNNTDWANTVWGETNVTLLPDAETNTTGYVWFGDKDTGMFSNTNENTSNGAVCGKAITKEVNLSNYSFPVLNFKSWFEVESVDVAKGMYDQMKVGFIIPSSSNGGASTVTIYTANGDKETVSTDTYYPLDSINPEYEPDIQDANVPYSSAGVNALPVWKNYSVAVDGLAGHNVKFVFEFKSMDSLFNGFRGWGIDDVKVENSMDNVLALPPMVPETNTTTEIVTNKVLR